MLMVKFEKFTIKCDLYQLTVWYVNYLILVTKKVYTCSKSTE